ncbi:AraC family transcriptional regulator ligand-binding domain-containing protein [Streptomyces olivochromogenes]|uniref:AraC family transcriptional regulator n=1 Tax=Streptomyces olivochromogenes TaxID=1963 RepID=A0A250VH33_STROL|nr:AraC family transcriptional regulator ligand-binding domain-containing protein [Streptomyces olivochromogenes]KUN45034.1 hypothetical protein AQJ27_23450 [Streptomyces olivochromogenes]GAX53386.1 AraC family transcriptional regulator [Streptomyces olivochromogenes]
MYSVALPKMVLARTAGTGYEAGRLAREAGIPAWAMDSDDITVANDCFLRTLVLAEHHHDVPDVGLRVGADFTPGQLGVYDYLFTTARTLGEGYAASGRYVDLITGVGQYAVVAATERVVRVTFSLAEDEDRGRELAIQTGMSDLISRSRWATGRPIGAMEVSLRQRAPRRSTTFSDFLGTTRITYGADTDSVTLRAADLELPLRTADPALAAIMERHAASLPRIQPRPTSWPDRVQQALAAAVLAEAPLSLTSVARRLATSPRTLQRRLAEAGTTWRHEVDRARQAQFARLHRHPAAPSGARAGLLGYSDARALRRARRRWAAR